MEFFMKEVRGFCKGDDTCLFLILVLIGFIICMFVSRNEGFLDYAEFDGSKDGHDYNENLIGKNTERIGREPEQLGIQLQKNEPSNGLGPVISGKYEMARKGNEVAVKPRSITISGLEILELDMPYLKFRVTCSKGTYIRSLAHDIGKTLKSGAWLYKLERTRIGKQTIQGAISLKEFEQTIRLR